MSRVIHIDSSARTIREAEWSGKSEDLRALVGGWIESGHYWDSGDVLFVDEEGLLKGLSHFFRFALREDGGQPLGGNGVIVGRERYDDEGNFLGTDDTTLTVDAIAPLVTFMTRQQADAWGRGNASEPAVIFYSVGPDGAVTEEIIARHGSIFRDMPEPKEG